MSEPADRILAVGEEHYKLVEAERDALKAQVAKLRESLQDVAEYDGPIHRAVRIAKEALSSPNPGAELLAKAKRAEALEASLIALRDGIDTPEMHCLPVPVTSSWRYVIDKALEQ